MQTAGSIATTPAELRYDWADEALKDALHHTGVDFIRSIVGSVNDYVNVDLPEGIKVSDFDRLMGSVRATLVPTWDLGWRIYMKEVPLGAYFAERDLSSAFAAGGTETLPIIVTAQFYFDYATFARNYALLRPGLRALDEVLPTGTSREHFALFRAIEVLSSVYDASVLARARAVDSQDDVTMDRVITLPSPGLISEIEEAAIEEDTRLAGQRRSTTVKALSYLMRSAEPLPMPDSAAGMSVVGLGEFYRVILDRAAESLDRDDRSENGKSDVYFRRAQCYHALGETDQAIVDMQSAISLVDNSNVYVTEQYVTFHRDLEQEQSIRRRVEAKISAIDDVLADKLADNLAESQRQIQKFAKDAAEDTRREISGALFRVVEILGVFMALIGLIGTTIGTAIFAEGNLVARVALLVGGYLAILSFFVLLRWIVRGTRVKEP